jgi:YtxH-like protein
MSPQSQKEVIVNHTNVLSHLSGAAVLHALGLQTRTSTTRTALTYAGFAVAGIVVGAAAAIMLTPKSGRQMRNDLRVGARGFSDHVGSAAASTMDAAKRRAGDARNSSEANTTV